VKIEPISFDSFSVRSMFTIVKTDLNIFIDPSVAIAPKRYGLEPSKQELKELKEVQNFIVNNYKKSDLFIITHYHWDHCPNPKSPQFEIFKSQKLFLIKDFNKTNKSQYLRANEVIKKAKEINKNFNFEIADNKEIEISNTLIKFTKPLWHGPENSPLGKVIGAYVEYKNNSLLFASDIQGILNKETLNELIKFNPKILIMSGPATYHYKWNRSWTQTNNKNLKTFIEKTNVKTIIIDHHLLRDLKYKEKIQEVLDFADQFNVKILTAAEFKGEKILQLEAHRKELKKSSA
jgi:predicted metallo-beta-lactamase superfamily hydrolase